MASTPDKKIFCGRVFLSNSFEDWIFHHEEHEAHEEYLFEKKVLPFHKYKLENTSSKRQLFAWLDLSPLQFGSLEPFSDFFSHGDLKESREEDFDSLCPQCSLWQLISNVRKRLSTCNYVDKRKILWRIELVFFAPWPHQIIVD